VKGSATNFPASLLRIPLPLSPAVPHRVGYPGHIPRI
jgi:hypothetical protein